MLKKASEVLVIIALLVGAVLGFVLALPPGPIGVTAIRFGLYGDIKPGTQLAIGTAMMDMFYCLIAIFAASAVESAIGGFSTNHPFLMLGLQFLIVLAFVLFGVFNLRSKGTEIDPDNPEKNGKHSKFVENLKTKGPFLLGVAIALTNIPNPTFLPSLVWVTMNVHQFSLIENTTFANLLFALGFGVGNFTWLYILIRLIVHFKPKMSAMMITRIRQFAGFTLIGFGTILGYRLITITKWSELVRIVFAF